MTTSFHSDWRNVPASTGRWPNVSPAEVACWGNGKPLVDEPALDRLQALRDRLDKPLIVHSSYRSPEHNCAVDGATRSKYLDGAAFDIAMTNHDPVAVEGEACRTLARSASSASFHQRSGFIHVDLGLARQRGERFLVRATSFAEKAPPAREVFADSRTMKGGGALAGRRRAQPGSRSHKSSWPKPRALSCRLSWISTPRAGCSSPRRLAALVLATILPSGCATDSSERRIVTVCRPAVEYGRAFQAKAAEEVASLPEGSGNCPMLSEYAMMRQLPRTCS